MNNDNYNTNLIWKATGTGGHTPQLERNTEIIRKYATGRYSFRKLAKEYKKSRQRIAEIWGQRAEVSQ